MGAAKATEAGRILALPPGPVRIVGGGAGLRRIQWLFPGQPPTEEGEGAAYLLLERARMALSAYFRSPHGRLPAVPLAPVAATPFQRRVWAAMCAIPPGETRTYGELARALGSSSRAVGQAAGANPWPILVPCHRVVAVRGPGGYVGKGEAGLAVKRWLLEHEGAAIPG